MNGVTYGVTYEIQTHADVRESHAPQYALLFAARDLACQPDVEEPVSDILAELDRALDQTPEHVYMCRPLTRRTVAAAAAEIRRLRAVLAVTTSPGKTQPVAVLLAALEAPALTASANDVPDGDRL